MAGCITIAGDKLLKAFDQGVAFINLRDGGGEGEWGEDEAGLEAAGVHATAQKYAVAFLSEALVRRPYCPTILDSGCCSVAHKIHALVHAVKLEHHTWHEALDAVKYLSKVTDHGTESGIVLVDGFETILETTSCIK